MIILRVISNAITFKPNAIPHAPGFIGIYGAEFSPNGNLLYISANNSLTNPATLFQFDITSHNPTTILSTKQIIAEPTPWYGGALQMGPDQKIYMSMWKDSAISVVENPDVVGAGCNFVLNKISFGLPASAEVLQYGLPNFMQSNFDPNLRPYDFYRGGNCTDLTVPFFINRLTGIDSVKWDFGDTQLSTQLNPVHPYATPGFYTVKLKVYYFNPCSGLEIDESSTKIWITGNENILGNDLEACVFNNEKIIAQINLPSANYLWNTGATTTEITTSSPGKYWLTLDYLGCKISDTINLFIKPPPIVNIGPDTTVCNAKPIILSGGNYVNATYLWNTGEKTRDIIINRAGKYYVTVTTDCVASDTVNVIAGDCEIFIPTAFTPNGDTKNDKFGVANDFSAKEFHFVVYDRWGNLIFETKENTKKWDGTYKGKTMPTGSYLWTMKYTTLKGIPKYEQGTVMLIR
ncbi:MAG: gliding motility-associated C-terminal domain-containing protein [Chitinophagaceae bacterium]|nr:gliding motility-associated C-terminal domain-containing protein [Chitinophagaceae bacterium]